MLDCIPAIKRPYKEIERIMGLIDMGGSEAGRDKAIDAEAHRRGHLFRRDGEVIAFLAILPYIETAGSVYYINRSLTCHVARIVLLHPFPLSVLLHAFYDTTHCEMFEFPMKLTSQPIPSAVRFNERLGLRLEASGVYSKCFPTLQSLPYWRQPRRHS